MGRTPFGLLVSAMLVGAVAAGSAIAADEGILVGKALIPAPSRELFREFV